MCGIVGYIGPKNANPILINGLRRLEYRGYDSAGIATLDGGELHICKEPGKVAELDKNCVDSGGTIGIGHTRWATHGEPNKVNAHPHQADDIAIVHNGIIENYAELKEELTASGVKFVSDTDTEVLAQLISSNYGEKVELAQAVRTSLKSVVGTFGLVVLSRRQPDQVVVARRGSPLVLGIGDEEMFVASDTAAIVGYTDKVIYLEDDQLAVCKSEEYDIIDLDNNAQTMAITTLDQDVQVAEKEGYDHFLIKEINEQPEVVKNTMRGRLYADGEVKLGGLNLSDEYLRQLEHIIIIGCGTAYFAGMMAKYLLEKMLNIPVSVEYASEFRYRQAALGDVKSVAIFMSQSGETADTLASLEEVKRRGIPSLGLINVVGSTLAREVDGGIYLHCGPEISVASTKAYSAMVVAEIMLGLKIARLKGMSSTESRSIAQALLDLPMEFTEALKLSDSIRKIAKEVKNTEHAFFLGRGDLYPATLEGALKLTEVSYIQSQPYAFGEMKHGPIALIDENFLSVALLPEDELLYSKSISNMQEVKARGGKILSISSRPKNDIATWHITTPKVNAWVEPLVINIALQLLAYYVAVARGNDVDQPRNLAKSVTVE